MVNRVNIAVIGSLDHGKSTLIGRLVYDTKSLPKDRLEEIAKKAKSNDKLSFSSLLDSFEEEKAGGFTLDTAQAIVRIKPREYNFIDCPGHKEFIRNMLTGVSQAEYAVLVISAKSDEGIDRQTKMHINLAKLLGIRKLFVAVNKMDAAGYKKKRFLELNGEIKDYLKSINFYRKSILVPISARNGDNIINNTNNMRWYHGETMIDIIKNNTGKYKSRKQLRALIQDTYFKDGRKLLFLRIEQGAIRKGDNIFINLAGYKNRIEDIFKGEDKISIAKEGDNVAVALEGNSMKIFRGEVISGLYSKPFVKDNFPATIYFLKDKFKSKKEFIFKCALNEAVCSLNLKHHKNGIYKAVLSLNKKIVIDSVNKAPSLNRFILLDGKSFIVALGRIDV